MSIEIPTAILLEVDGLIYSEKDKRYTPTISYINTRLNINMATLYKGHNKQSSTTNAHEMLDRISRQFYNYIYDVLTWSEDFDKKQYIILTNEDVVRLSRDIMVSHMESIVLTRRDLLALEHGVDLDGNKLIEDFDKNMEMYQFSLDTRRMFNQNRIFKYRERLNLRDIDPSVIRFQY